MCLCSPYIFVKIREKEKKRMEQIYRIAIDHGYGKTAHHIFKPGVIE